MVFGIVCEKMSMEAHACWVKLAKQRFKESQGCLGSLNITESMKFIKFGSI